MSVVWPEKFIPRELGQSTKLNLPGVANRSALRIATIAPGVTVTHSRFFEPLGRQDHIKRQAETLLMVFGLEGVLRLRSVDEEVEIAPQSCLIVQPGEAGLERVVPADLQTSTFVLALERRALQGALAQAISGRGPGHGVFEHVKIDFVRVASFNQLFDPEIGSGALLRVEAHCLALIADVLAASRANEKPLEDRVVAFLMPRLAEKIELDAVARGIGTNRTELNAKLKAATGETVFALLRRLRREKAQQLIDSTRMTRAQIAAETGFSSASHLCRTLRQSG